MAREDHALACALYGDCIYDVVQEGAQALQSRWESDAKSWDSLLDEAVKSGILGWGRLVSRDWLSAVMFRPREWPKGLTEEEKKILRLAAGVSGFNRRYNQGPAPARDPDLGSKEGEAQTLEALKRYTDLFKKRVAIPMYRSYDEVSNTYGRRIQPLCEENYQERCSVQESIDIFKGDLRRGHKVKTLDVKGATYLALSRFWDWIAA